MTTQGWWIPAKVRIRYYKNWLYLWLCLVHRVFITALKLPCKANVAHTTDSQCPGLKSQVGGFAILINEFKRIINIRHNYIQLKKGYLEWNHREDHSRLLHYKRVAETEKTKINIIINAESNSIALQANGNLIYSRNYYNNRLLANGIIIFKE